MAPKLADEAAMARRYTELIRRSADDPTVRYTRSEAKELVRLCALASREGVDVPRLLALVAEAARRRKERRARRPGPRGPARNEERGAFLAMLFEWLDLLVELSKAASIARRRPFEAAEAFVRARAQAWLHTRNDRFREPRVPLADDPAAREIETEIEWFLRYHRRRRTASRIGPRFSHRELALERARKDPLVSERRHLLPTPLTWKAIEKAFRTDPGVQFRRHRAIPLDYDLLPGVIDETSRLLRSKKRPEDARPPKASPLSGTSNPRSAGDTTSDRGAVRSPTKGDDAACRTDEKPPESP